MPTGAHVEFTKQNVWPDVTPPGWSGPLQYTLWIVLNINGQWHASGCIEYWRGLYENGGSVSQYAQNCTTGARVMPSLVASSRPIQQVRWDIGFVRVQYE